MTVRKSLRLKKETDEIIEHYRQSHHCSSWTAALESIVKNSAALNETDTTSLVANKVADRMYTRLLENLNKESVGIRLSSRSADRNTQVILKVLNQMLYQNAPKGYQMKDHGIMKEAKDHTDAEIERFRQIRLDQAAKKKTRSLQESQSDSEDSAACDAVSR